MPVITQPLDKYRRRVADAVKCIQSSSVSVEPIYRGTRQSRFVQASRRFRQKMEDAEVTTKELLSNLQRVKRELAEERQSR
jgi:uncharacterized protein YukE